MSCGNSEHLHQRSSAGTAGTRGGGGSSGGNLPPKLRSCGAPSLVENCQNARGCFSTGDCSVYSLATNFNCSYHEFTLIRTYVIIFVLDLSITKCLMKLFLKFERVLLVTRGCSRTLKTPNSPPLGTIHPTLVMAVNIKGDYIYFFGTWGAPPKKVGQIRRVLVLCRSYLGPRETFAPPPPPASKSLSRP